MESKPAPLREHPRSESEHAHPFRRREARGWKLERRQAATLRKLREGWGTTNKFSCDLDQTAGTPASGDGK